MKIYMIRHTWIDRALENRAKAVKMIPAAFFLLLTIQIGTADRAQSQPFTMPFAVETLHRTDGSSLKTTVLPLFNVIALNPAKSVNSAIGQTGVRRYAVPMDGFVELDVPISWQEKLSRLSEESIDVTISFRPSTGDDFLIMVTVYPVTDQESVNSTALRQRLEEAVLPPDLLIAEEKNLTVQQLQGAMGAGYFYHVTDKQLKEGERKLADYRYVTRGMLPVKNGFLYFSIMTHEKGSPIRVQALEMLKKARTLAASADRSTKHYPTDEKREVRHYEIPQDGILKLNVPTSWQDYVKKEQSSDIMGSVAITFLPKTGDDCWVEITAVVVRGPSSPEARRQFIELIAIQTALKHSEEKEIKPHDMQLSRGVGAYHDYTVKNVNEGERTPGRFRHMRVAYLAFDGLVVQVSIGTHDKDSFVKTEVLEMMRNARGRGI